MQTSKIPFEIPEALQFLLSCFPDKYSLWLRVCEELDYGFKDLSLLAQAFTHRSALNELQYKLTQTQSQKLSWLASLPWNESMEFLGDSVLSLAVSTWLWHHSSLVSEGDYSKRRSMLVQAKTLVQVAKRYDMGKCMIIGGAAEKSGARDNDGLLGDAVEAFVGAVYLDSDFVTAYAVVERMFFEIFRSAEEQNCLPAVEDYKTRLQEVTQQCYGVVPEYVVINEDGPCHAKEFVVECRIQGGFLAQGKGSSKKRASQAAAAQMLRDHDFKENGFE